MTYEIHLSHIVTYFFLNEKPPLPRKVFTCEFGCCMSTNDFKFNPRGTLNQFLVQIEVKDGSEIKIKCTRLDRQIQ